jgi:prepilin-type N-terminal cleavage/methylation domain-containing protein
MISVLCSAGRDRENGFTLIELAVVLAVLAGAFLLAFPDFGGFDRRALGSEARKLSGLISALDEEATLRKVYYRAWFDPAAETVRIESSPDGAEFKPDGEVGPSAFKLKESVDLVDAEFQGFGRVSDGSVAVVFNPTFGAEPFILRLASSDSVVALAYNPYSGRAEVTADDY